MCNPTITAQANRPPPSNRASTVLIPPCEMLATPTTGQPGCSGASATAALGRRYGERAIPVETKPASTSFLARILHDTGWTRRRAPTLREGRKRNGNDQRSAVEQGFHEERAAELLDSGNADGEDQDAKDRAPDVDPARLDGSRAEECADEGGQQIVEPDIRLADPKLGGEHAAGKPGDQAGGDEHADHIGPDRDAVERSRLLVGADRGDVAADGQPFADYPEHDRQDDRVDGCDRDDGDRQGVDADEARGQQTADLAPIGMPKGKRVEDGAGAERGDEGVDLRHFEEQALDQAAQRAAGHKNTTPQ